MLFSAYTVDYMRSLNEFWKTF